MLKLFTPCLFCIKPTNDISKLDDAPNFTLDGQFLHCKVIDVYDGDTITIIFPFEGKAYKKKCRLFGIDTPEIRTKNIEEKEAGIVSRDWLKTRILNRMIWIRFQDWDKYGRLLGILYDTECSEKSINRELVEYGFAYEYDGGTKKKFGIDVHF